ncbi:hypothetical protein V1478_018288 [Vespula squamosa]|uniref:Uncharacterized protein n=1 Tax=Vespula squamosa TaxID=30214 RepID=A0ABD1ZUM2_VESSQ
MDDQELSGIIIIIIKIISSIESIIRVEGLMMNSRISTERREMTQRENVKIKNIINPAQTIKTFTVFRDNNEYF